MSPPATALCLAPAPLHLQAGCEQVHEGVGAIDGTICHSALLGTQLVSITLSLRQCAHSITEMSSGDQADHPYSRPGPSTAAAAQHTQMGCHVLKASDHVHEFSWPPCCIYCSRRSAQTTRPLSVRQWCSPAASHPLSPDASCAAHRSLGAAQLLPNSRPLTLAPCLQH